MSLKKTALSGIIWTFFEMFGGQFINFFVNIILARKLFPEDYGLLGMILIFVTVSNTLMDSGISISILRKKEVEQKDYETLFLSNIGLSIIIYTILFFIAPLIASFYQKPIITSLVRVYGITIIIQAFVQVQSLYLIKSLQFKKQTFMKLPSIFISSAIAIYMAYNGYGVWSLVWMYILQNFFWALFHWCFGDWNPKISFDYAIFKKHFNFGYKLTLVEFLNNITANIYQIVIGRFYSPAAVGYFTQATTLRQIPVSNIYGAAIKVLFPIFSKIQDDEKSFAKNIYLVQELLLLVLCPVFFLMIFQSHNILVVLFSEKWVNATFYLQILCIAGLFNVMSSYSIFALKIKTDSKVILQYEIILKFIVLFFITLSVFFFHNIKALVITIPISAAISYLLYNAKLSKLLNVSKSKGMKLILEYSVVCSVIILFLYIVQKYIVIKTPINTLSINIILFFTFYILIIFSTKKSIIKTLRSIVTK